MTALDIARNAYSAPAAPARTPRAIEYDLFARATRRLKAAQMDAGSDMGLLAAALHENRQLWTALAADVAEPGNALPAPLRAQIFYLYEFTVQHSRKIMDGQAAIDVLIDINTAIMRGLRGEGAVP